MTPRPTHLLRHEHRVIERTLRAMNGICLRLKLQDPVPQSALLKILDFTMAYADRYHHKREEKHLFPALAGAGLNGALEFLHEEHVLERDLLAQLELAVTSYNPKRSDSIERLVETSERFTSHLIGHMQKEDSLLFRIAEEVLDDSEKRALMHALGSGDHDSALAYEKLAEELESTWAV